MKKNLLFSFSLLFLFALPLLTLGVDSGDPPGGPDSGDPPNGRTTLSIPLPNILCDGIPSTEPCLASFTARVIGALRDLSYLAVALMVLVGGFQMMFSGGDPAKFGKGQKTVLYAIIGFALIFLAQGIAFVIQSFLEE